MLRTALGALVVTAAVALPVPQAGAEPGGGILDFVATFAKYGQGATAGTITGAVVAGDGELATGATLAGNFSANEPASLCPLTGTAAGTLTSSAGLAVSFAWTHVGGTAGSVTMTTTGSMSTTATGSYTVISPVGNPCGASNVQVRIVIELVGDFAPIARGHVTIHRFPASMGSQLGGVRLWVAPVAQNGVAWTCRDVNTGNVVVRGSLLASPHPGVTCTPPSGYGARCVRVDAGGYHADAGSGTVTVASACGTLGVSATIQVPSSWPGYSRSAAGNGATPWTCRVTESLANAAETDYWVFCDANTP